MDDNTIMQNDELDTDVDMEEIQPVAAVDVPEEDPELEDDDDEFDDDDLDEDDFEEDNEEDADDEIDEEDEKPRVATPIVEGMEMVEVEEDADE